MIAAVADYVACLQRMAVGFFFYAGHGAANSKYGENYLIQVAAQTPSRPRPTKVSMPKRHARRCTSRGSELSESREDARNGLGHMHEIGEGLRRSRSHPLCRRAAELGNAAGTDRQRRCHPAQGRSGALCREVTELGESVSLNRSRGHV